MIFLNLWDISEKKLFWELLILRLSRNLFGKLKENNIDLSRINEYLEMLKLIRNIRSSNIGEVNDFL